MGDVPDFSLAARAAREVQANALPAKASGRSGALRMLAVFLTVLGVRTR